MMSKTIIPGLSFVPADEEEDDFIEIPSFKTIIRVPQAHIYGNCRPRNDFGYIKTVYEGNFGTVYSVQDKKDGEIYALKKYVFTEEMKSNGIPKLFLDEISVLKVLKHGNLVNLHGVIAGNNLTFNFLLLDYCAISLQDIIDKKCDAVYERDVVKYIMRQLFDGLSYIHESLIIHRNISCRNLHFTDSGILKIGGSRTAAFYNPAGMPFIETELGYRAPEILLKTKYGQPADIWSAGCVLAYLLLKNPLFSGDSEEALLELMFLILGTPSEAIWPGFDNILKKDADNEKIIKDPQPYSDIKNILTGVPEPSSELLQDLIIYYPAARMKAIHVLKSHYILDTPPECSPGKMKTIIETALSVPESTNASTDVPMQVDK